MSPSRWGGDGPGRPWPEIIGTRVSRRQSGARGQVVTKLMPRVVPWTGASSTPQPTLTRQSCAWARTVRTVSSASHGCALWGLRAQWGEPPARHGAGQPAWAQVSSVAGQPGPLRTPACLTVDSPLYWDPRQRVPLPRLHLLPPFTLGEVCSLRRRTQQVRVRVVRGDSCK